jgi:ribosomal protein S27AE
MSTVETVNNMLYQLIVGLQQWRITPTILPNELRKGHLMLVKMRLFSNEEVPSDIPSLIQFLQQPVSDWKIDLTNVAFPQDAPLLIRHIGMSPEAMDFLQDYQSPYEAHQKEVYEILKYCRHAEPPLVDIYSQIRLFLASPAHAVITGVNLHSFARSVRDPELSKRILECYEPIPDRVSDFRKCNRCGWTLHFHNHQWRCGVEDICGQIEARGEPLGLENSMEMVYRLKEGVHRYTLLPGLAELQIANRLTKKGYQVKMYPEVDRFDVAVHESGQIIYFDVKDYRNPCSLAAYFNQLDPAALQKYREEHVHIVVPSYRKRSYRQYIRQALNTLKPAIRKDIQIIDESVVLRIVGGIRQ